MTRDATQLDEKRGSLIRSATFWSKMGIIAVRLIVAVPLPRALPPGKTKGSLG
jgi:hypothetical protein